MAKGTGSRPSSGKGSSGYGRGATPAQLSQKSGTTQGGWTKTQTSNGGFTMKPAKGK